MENLHIYDSFKEAPPEALKPITGGRLKGMSDINPMWRIRKLTEQFGPCGIGWKYEIVSQRIEEGANGEKAAFVDILLYYRNGDTWSEPVPGAGGSMFVTKESKGLHTDDECFKKALTDAIGVGGKALGLAANVYWSSDRTKYNSTPQAPLKHTPSEQSEHNKTGSPNGKYISDKQQKRLWALAGVKDNKELAEGIVRELLDEYELKATGEIKSGEEYNEICEKAELLLAERLV